MIEQIYGTKNIEELATLFLRELNKKDSNVIDTINYFLPALWLYQSLNTVAVRYSHFRKVLKRSRRKKAKEALNILKFDTRLSVLVNDKRIENAKGRKENKKEFDTNFFKSLIVDLKSNIENIRKKDFKKANNQTFEQIEAYHIATYLALVTGRRFVEILKTFKIEKRGTNVKFNGLVKKPEDERLLQNACLLDDYKTVKKHLTRLRKILDVSNMTNDEVNKKYSAIFNRYLKDKILQSDTKFTFHDLRGIYAELCYLEFAKDNEDKKDFFSKILGHRGIFTSTDHYLNKKAK